jgi:ferredoxin
MSQRGVTKKTRNSTEMTLERPMVTRHYRMVWDLEKCVGCQMGPAVCSKNALTHIDGEIRDGRLVTRPSVDVDPEKCVLCGMCVVVCPMHAIDMAINGEKEIPVQKYEAFPALIAETTFSKADIDYALKDYVIDNCSAHVIRYDADLDTMLVDDENCIHCRQCEIASQGAFTVHQPWQGAVVLHADRCVEGCLACADICPTRALHVDENNRLVLADYYCIKCGACMHVCPIKPDYQKVAFTFESQGLTLTREFERLTNEGQLAIHVERWRVNHTPVSSAAWVEALRNLSDDKAKMVEMDRTRALRRKDLIQALRKHILPSHRENEG